MFQQRGHHLALADLRAGQAPDDRHALGGADQVEPEAPEVAGVAGAEAVAGVPGQRRAANRLPGGRARQWGGVHQPQQVVPGAGVPGQFSDHRGDQRPGRAQPLAVAGLPGQVREHPRQVGPDVADPVPLAGHPEQLLGHHQAQQLGIGERRFAAPPMRPRTAHGGQHTVFQVYVECRQEGVEFVAHNLGLGTLRPPTDGPTRSRANRTHSSRGPDAGLGVLHALERPIE